MLQSFRWLVPTVQQPTLMDGVLAIICIALAFAVQRFLIPKIVRMNVQFFERKGDYLFARLWEQSERSVRHAWLVSALFLALSILFQTSLFSAPKTSTFYLSTMIYFAFKAIYDVLSYYTDYPEKFTLADKERHILTPFFLRMMRVIIMLIALFTIAALWDFNLNGFLTGIGLTGVAMAFGIRDTLGHVFGGLSIALDKPFQIGDWVATDDQKIDGVIEDINLRSTLIQTGDKGLVYVPNAYLVNRPLYNYSKREKRKCEFHQYVSIDNDEQAIRQLCEQAREQIYLHPQTEKDVIHVAVDEMRPHAMRILVRFYVQSGDTADLLAVQQDILFALRDLYKETNIQVVDNARDAWHYSS